MATLSKLVLVGSLVAALFGWQPAAAQEPVVGVDGCGILATLVYTELTDAGLRRSSGPGSMLVFPQRGDLTICNHTARTVTRAFSKSMQQMNIYVSWGQPPRDSGDYCDSHYLDQCYPDNNPLMPPMSDAEFAFVVRSWRAVRMALTPSVTSGLQGDVSRFGHRELQLGLRHSLRRGSRAVR